MAVIALWVPYMEIWQHYEDMSHEKHGAGLLSIQKWVETGRKQIPKRKKESDKKEHLINTNTDWSPPKESWEIKVELFLHMRMNTW